MKKAKAQRRKKLPLNSPNWWTYDKTVRYVRARMGDKDIADSDLVAAIERGDVPSKLEQVRMEYDPPARRSKLLTPDFYQRDYKFVRFWDRWVLKPRTDQVLLGRWSVYFWGPKIERIWPTAAPTVPTGQRADEKPRRRSRTQEMIREIAADEWPDGCEHLETDYIRQYVGKILKDRGLPVPKRDVFLRALDRRD
jgi:hypothetical protein